MTDKIVLVTGIGHIAVGGPLRPAGAEGLPGDGVARAAGGVSVVMDKNVRTLSIPDKRVAVGSET